MKVKVLEYLVISLKEKYSIKKLSINLSYYNSA